MSCMGNRGLAIRSYPVPRRAMAPPLQSAISCLGEGAFGGDIDYAQLVKLYGEDKSQSPEHKYSP